MPEHNDLCPCDASTSSDDRYRPTDDNKLDNNNGNNAQQSAGTSTGAIAGTKCLGYFYCTFAHIRTMWVFFAGMVVGGTRVFNISCRGGIITFFPIIA